MTAKAAYQFNSAGVFIGTTDADESPMEAGVFLLPAGCTFAEPPAATTGKVARWNGSTWALVNAPSTPADAVENPLAKLQAFLTANPDVAGLLNTTGGV